MELLIWLGVFALALAALVLSSDWFVNASESIGLSLGWPPFIIGVIIVGVGTSLPELMSSIMAVLQGAPEIVAGNVFGSNITNIFLIAGLAGILGGSVLIQFDFLKVDAAFLIGTLTIVAFSVMDGFFMWTEGILVLLMLIIYVWYSLKNDSEDLGELPKAHWYHWLLLAATPVGIFLGADWTIKSVIELSGILGINSEVVAVTMVALGTSLPEVMVTIQAARKGKTEIAIGNIIGSNVFNLLAVMGIPALLTLFIPSSTASGPVSALIVPESLLLFSLPLLGVATIAFIFVLLDKKVNWAEGSLFLILYLFFIGKNYGFI